MTPADQSRLKLLKARAKEAIGDRAELWLQSPQRALNERTPLEVASTSEGMNEVMNLLGAVEDGGYM
jgi:uncharacterized protein (DUF2384 family)